MATHAPMALNTKSLALAWRPGTTSWHSSSRPTPATTRTATATDADSEQANGFEVLYGSPKHQALAQTMQTTLLKVVKLKDRKIKLRTDLAVLKFKGPAVLIELGFIAFDSDRQTILNPQVRADVCAAIADVIQAS